MRDVTDPAFYVGWDVGGWNCDRNASSRDALVVLDTDLNIVGRSWRGNLRTTINTAANTREFVSGVGELCQAEPVAQAKRVVMAIDTPLGFAEEFVALVSGAGCWGPVGSSAGNRYLFRRTERMLFERGLRPLSAVKDMLGSQTTKGLHMLAKFAPVTASCGVWQSADGQLLTALEAYPAGCRASRRIAALRSRVTGKCGETPDERDALTCALIAYLHTTAPDELIPAEANVPPGEGWIWLPRDAMQGEWS